MMQDPGIDRLYTATRRMQQGEFVVDIERGAADALHIRLGKGSTFFVALPR